MDSISVCSLEASTRPVKRYIDLDACLLAAFSMPTLPAKTIKSAIDTFLIFFFALNSDCMDSNVSTL